MVHFQNNNNNNEHDTDANSGAAAVSKKMTLPLENDLPNPNFVRLQGDKNQDLAKEGGPVKLSSVKEDILKDVKKEDKPAPESFLKSILLDRMTRKRSFGEDETPYVVKKSSEEETIPKVPRSPKATHMPPPAEDCNDILRRRLLGLKDPNYELMQRQPPSQKSARPLQPQHNNGRLLSNVEVKETPAEEMKGVDHEEVVQTVEGAVPSVEDRVSFVEDDVSREDKVGPPQVEAAARPPDYSHTSVLKHLLHRYTGGENNDDGEDDNGKRDMPGA